MTNISAVVVDGLQVRRGGREVLRGVTFEVPRGTVTGLLGPSGCGKTTLMRCVVGVQIVHAGKVSVLGQPAGSAKLRTRIGYATQSPAVYIDLTVREAEILRLLTAGSTNKEIAARLVLSIHTIERHLQNAYRKIGVRNRADAAAYAVRATI